jgi:hypothetical protein
VGGAQGLIINEPGREESEVDFAGRARGVCSETAPAEKRYPTKSRAGEPIDGRSELKQSAAEAKEHTDS